MADDNDVKAEDIIEDARSAMRWVRGNAKKFGINPDMIASGGGSAGGHLAACVMLIDEFNAEEDDMDISTEPNLMILFNPAIARGSHPLFSDEFNKQAEEHFKGRSRGPVPNVSPMTYVQKKQPPCIMYFGTEDKLLHPAEVFCEESKKAGNECSIVLYEGQGHAFFNYRDGNNKYYDLTLAETDNFLVKHGFLKEE
jgi:acetyl esterase/lipase